MTEINERFKAARQAVLSESVSTEGVGGLAEKSVHKILKLTLEPNTSMHEVKFLGSIADIKNGEGIFEIQTKNHHTLIPKLKKFLPNSKVTIVIPLIKEKFVRWINVETGEISEKKRSPKHDDVYTALNLIFSLSELISDKNLKVKLVFFEADEYKRLDGWDKTRKRGASKADKIPTKILEVIDLDSVESYRRYIPEELANEFLAKDFQKAIKRPARFTYYVIRFFVGIGLIEQVGKRGNAFVYKINYDSSSSIT